MSEFSKNFIFVVFFVNGVGGIQIKKAAGVLDSKFTTRRSYQVLRPFYKDLITHWRSEFSSQFKEKTDGFKILQDCCILSLLYSFVNGVGGIELFKNSAHKCNRYLKTVRRYHARIPSCWCCCLGCCNLLVLAFLVRIHIITLIVGIVTFTAKVKVDNQKYCNYSQNYVTSTN